MEDKSVMTVMPGLITLFVLSSFNSVFFFNLRAYNILSIMLFLLIMSHLALLFLEWMAPPRAYMFPLLVFLFLAGINLKDRPKLFVFLCAAYCVHLFFFQRESPGAGRSAGLLLKIIAAASAVISLLCFVLLLLRLAGFMVLIAATIALLIGQIMILKTLSDGNPPAVPSRGRRAHDKR